MSTFHVRGPFRAQYYELTEWIRDEGDHVSPRDLDTREMRDASIVFARPDDVLVTGTNRKLNTKIAAREALMLIGGFMDPRWIIDASPPFIQFAEGGNFHGGYGMRTRGQLPRVIEILVEDPSSRRAQIVLWDPAYDLLVEDARDYPCTTSIQFLIRMNRLEAHVHMRSNDAWRGLPYDIFVFAQLQAAVAAMLRLEAGPLHHHVTSLHLYESDFPAMKDLKTSPVFDPILPLYQPVSRGGMWVAEHWKRLARQLRDNIRLGANLDHGMTELFNQRTLDWYLERVV